MEKRFFYPVIVQLHSKDKAQYERENKQLYAIVFYVSVAVSALTCLLAEPIAGILYGEACLPAVMPLRIVTRHAAFSCLGVARNARMACENRRRRLKCLCASAAATDVVLDFALIPVFGASGAAFASLVTQVSTTMVLPFAIRPLRPNAMLMLDAVLLRGVLPARRG